MGTRAIIVVHGQDLYTKNRTVRLYKHSDGYPTGALEVIEEALAAANTKKYTPYGAKEVGRVNVSTLVGCLIGAGTSEYGMGVGIDSEWASASGEDAAKASNFEEAFDPKKHLGNQGDLEWIYVLDLAKSTLTIANGNTRKLTPCDPYSYVECLREECKGAERDETDRLLRYVGAWGFKLITKVSKAPRAVKKGA